MALNANPIVYELNTEKYHSEDSDTPVAYAQLLFGDFSSFNDSKADEEEDPVDADEIFQLIRNLNDPEHPLSLEQLRVVQKELIVVNSAKNHLDIRFTPTIPHCSMATLIGLCIRVKLLRSLPAKYKVDITITPGTHASEHQGMSQCIPIVKKMKNKMFFF